MRGGTMRFPLSADMRAAVTGDLTSAADATMGTYKAALSAQVPQVVAIGREMIAQLRSALSTSVDVQIRPTISGPGPAVSPTAVRRSGGGDVHIQSVSVHGVRDAAGFHREISRMADRQARDSQSGALHDLGTGYVG